MLTQISAKKLLSMRCLKEHLERARLSCWGILLPTFPLIERNESSSEIQSYEDTRLESMSDDLEDMIFRNHPSKKHSCNRTW